MAALAAACAAAPLAHGGEVDDLKAQLAAMQEQMDKLKAHLEQVSNQVQQQQQSAAAAPASSGGWQPSAWARAILDESQFYGNLDVSFDDTTKGLKSSYTLSDGSTASPVGRTGWLPAISTNLSYIGWRGRHELDENLAFLWQLETQIDISATAGTSNNNSSNDSTVKGALTSRNTYIGLSGPGWGAVKIGKTDAPYKNSTARMNPFSGMLGDYSVIMGNTGGDNRVEFGGRVDHAIWYESPDFGGITFNALFSPGQNRTTDSSGIAAGESSCAGGNVPGSGALPPVCSDGAFNNLYSANLAYTNGPLYLTAAYEMHTAVNRVSDTIGVATTPPQFAASGDPNDIGNESAAKVGIQYRFPTKTTVSAIYESMRRNVPAYLAYQNERQRTGYWLALTQSLTPKDDISFGWAHANKAQGDPGQHNTDSGPHDNSANLYTAAFKHELAKNTWWYADYAMTANHASAHYDLGAGGRGVTTDCHDGSTLAAVDVSSGAPQVTGDGPHCYAGGRLQGISVGLDFKF
ncbi:MAG: porin [Proteobacteria bacterium]|nr:porin [Pseudomonadota bacterium]